MNKVTSNNVRAAKVAAIKKAIKDKTYDWTKAIEGAAERILNNPESLLWK